MTVSLHSARCAAQAAIDFAEAQGEAICVAVCNVGGRLVAFFKMDGTDALAGHEAIRRAISSAGTGRPSEMVATQAGSASSAALEGLGASNRPGGLPFLSNGECVGSIGVCGSAGSDVACARAGVEAFAAHGAKSGG